MIHSAPSGISIASFVVVVVVVVVVEDVVAVTAFVVAIDPSIP
jgi:hypothetical protein